MPDSPHEPASANDASAEVLMANKAVTVGLLLAVAAVAIVAPWRGWSGALTALGAVVLVVGNFVATGRSLAWAATKSLAVLQGVALGGLFARLVLYAVLIVVLNPVEAIDGPVLAVTVALSTIVLLTYETRFVLRTSQLWWVDAGPADTAPVPAGVGTTPGKDRP